MVLFHLCFSKGEGGDKEGRDLGKVERDVSVVEEGQFDFGEKFERDIKDV